MTQDELDALPEDGVFSFTTELRDGKTVRVPRYHSVGALWTNNDEPCSVVDVHGDRWMLGWAKGVRYKRKLRS